MKKLSVVILILTILAVAAAFAFSGINRQEVGKSVGKNGGVTRGMNRRLVMGYSQIGAESEWQVACADSVRSAATDWNVNLRFSDAQQRQENQIQAIRAFIRQGVDIIAFAPMNPAGWEAVLEECKEAGIPVICIDRAIDAPGDLCGAFIGSGFKAEGAEAAVWLAGYMDKIGRGDKNPINVVEVQGRVCAIATADRQRGFAEEMAKHPNYKLIRYQTDNFTRVEGKQVMEARLKSDGGIIDAVFAHYDEMAIGAIQAIEEYGLKPGKDIIIVSVEAAECALEAMTAGKLNAAIERNPLLGPEIMAAAVRLVGNRQ
jgi:simple sugar transport system substrate-binding protein